MARKPTSKTARITAYPTRVAVYALALGLPISLIVALISPAFWYIGAAWAAGAVGMMALDWLAAIKPAAMRATLDGPSVIDVGQTVTVGLDYERTGPDGQAPAPQGLEVRLSTTDQLSVSPEELSAANLRPDQNPAFSVYAKLRGDAKIERLWQRWTGPFRLMWLQRVDAAAKPVTVVVDTKRLTQDALALFSRHADFGQTLQKLRGEGTEFDALSDFVQGMDPRAIDWKHSARHGTLLAREYETEKNNHIVFAYDSGYLMNEESEDKTGRILTKLDRAISAGMLLGFTSLRLGDRVGVYAFDEKPYLYTPPLTGSSAFAQLQASAAQIDYSASETNFTLGLTTLSQRLRRRTLVVVFSDFVDTTQAELMVENVSRLMKRHAVVFVTFKNASLRALTDQTPEEPVQLAEAIIAGQLRQERELVLARLERMGVWVINTDPDHLNANLINTYVALKARNVI